MADELKSAYELAMERLRAKDAGEVRPELSADQKEEIAEIRREFKAKRAELEIAFGGPSADRGPGGDPGEAEAAQEEYRRRLRELEEQEEARVAKVRGEGREG